MSKFKSTKMNKDQMRSAMLKVLADKDLAKYFVNYTTAFNIKTLTSQD
jgi:hypothetical protein